MLCEPSRANRNSPGPWPVVLAPIKAVLSLEVIVVPLASTVTVKALDSSVNSSVPFLVRWMRVNSGPPDDILTTSIRTTMLSVGVAWPACASDHVVWPVATLPHMASASPSTARRRFITPPRRQGFGDDPMLGREPQERQPHRKLGVSRPALWLEAVMDHVLGGFVIAAIT